MRNCDLCLFPIEGDQLLSMQQLSIPEIRGVPGRILYAHPACMDFYLGSRPEVKVVSELTEGEAESCSSLDGKS